MVHEEKKVCKIILWDPATSLINTVTFYFCIVCQQSQWILHPPGVQDVMGPIPDGDSDFSLSNTFVMLIYI